MTSEQREILKANLEGVGSDYVIQGLEYPAAVNAHRMWDCLKITTRMVESDEIFVDFYAADGSTVERRSFFARETTWDAT